MPLLAFLLLMQCSAAGFVAILTSCALRCAAEGASSEDQGAQGGPESVEEEPIDINNFKPRRNAGKSSGLLLEAGGAESPRGPRHREKLPRHERYRLLMLVISA
jgi:hypothetical protein